MTQNLFVKKAGILNQYLETMCGIPTNVTFSTTKTHAALLLLFSKKTGYQEDNQSLDVFGTVSSLSTSESWATENPYEEPPTPKPPSLIAGGKSKASGPKTVHFSDTREQEDGDYMVGGDAKYSSLKSEGYDFF